MSRIKSSNVQLGNSYIINNDAAIKKEKEKQEQLEHQQKQIEEFFDDAKKQAEEIIKNANIEASKIVENANQQAQVILQQAHDVVKQAQQEGFDTGYNDGFNKILSDSVNQIKNIEFITKATFKVKQEIISSSEREILQLTITIAEKIIRQYLEIHPEIILNIVKSAVNEIKDKEEIKILVNPALTQCLYDFSDELKQTIKGLKSLKIIEDKTIPADGVIIESPESRIDARLETQIAEISKRLLIETSENPVLTEIPKEIEIKIEEYSQDDP
ncbi:MAG: FliH/SctL family protein [bacterium]